MNKAEIHRHLVEQHQAKLQQLEQELADLRFAQQSDTKSSAGDKHEVGRAMAQLEIDKLSASIARARQEGTILYQLEGRPPMEQVSPGSLVRSSLGDYYLAIPLGLLRVADCQVFVISRDAPIGQLLIGREVGEQLEFNGRSLRIEAIL